MSEVSETAEVLDAAVAEAVSEEVTEETAAVIESATAEADASEVEANGAGANETEIDNAVEIAEEVLAELHGEVDAVEAVAIAEEVLAELTSEVEAESAVEDAVEETVADVVAELEVVAIESVSDTADSDAGESSTDVSSATTEEKTTETTGEAKRVVRTLAVGQEIQGTVKRISEFGAFVDIGVGRDGLVHISELSVKRVGKVTDVITEGQQIQVWIKKLDRERNRISLTLIPPGTVTIRDLNKDDIVTGTVTRILPYGAFIDIGVGRDALLHVREMGERYIAKPEEIVKVGEQIEAKIIEIQRRRGRIDLSIKGLRPEPEVETPVVEESVAKSDGRGGKAEAAPEVVQDDAQDAFAEVEVISSFQLALQRAQERSGVELEYQNKSSKSKNKDKQRREQEEIFERTLKTR